VFSVYAYNVGSVPASVRVALLLGGEVIEESEERIIPPSVRESFPLSLPQRLSEKVEAGSSHLQARVRFRRRPVKAARVGRGERRTL
jgi:hypothetical protein